MLASLVMVLNVCKQLCESWTRERREDEEELFKLQTKEQTNNYYHNKRTKGQQESKGSEVTGFTQNKGYSGSILNNDYLTQIAVAGQQQGIGTTSYFKKINKEMK